MNLTGIKGVIFDLDGTLVESSLNFTQMRADVGCPQHEDILTFVNALSCAKTRANAHHAILQHELAPRDDPEKSFGPSTTGIVLGVY